MNSRDKVPRSVISDGQPRSSSIELLRIIAMLYICLHHFCTHSSFQWSSMTPGLFTIQCLSIGGRIGVNVFMLITGYFLVYKNISGMKLLRLYLQILFYSIGLYLITSLIFTHSIDGLDLRTALMPISNNSYWFATAYLTIYIFVPFLNIFIRSLSKMLFFRLICLCVGIWPIVFFITMQNPNYSDFIWLIFLYLVGAYIRLYPPMRFTSCMSNFFIVLVLSAMQFLNLFILNMVSDEYLYNVSCFLSLDNLFTFLIALFLLLIFINLRIPNSRLINIIASTTFGVYLAHENPWFRSFLWSDIFHTEKYQESPYLLLYAIGTVILVFAFFAFIDLIRQFVLEKPLMKYIDRFGPAISAPFIHIWKAIWQKIYVEDANPENAD